MPARRSLRALVDVLFAVVAVALGAWSFWPTYQSSAFILMLAATLLLGTAIAVAGWAWRLPSIAVAGLVVLVYLGTGVQLAVPSEAAAGGLLPSPEGFVDLVQGTWLSWKQLVTITVPVGSYQALLVPAFLLTLLATVLTVTVALRSSRPELAAIPPVLLVVAGILLGSSVAPVPLLLLLALFVVILAWLIRFRLLRRSAAVRTLREQSGQLVESRSERVSTAVLTAAGATVMVVAAAAGGSPRRPCFPRPATGRSCARRSSSRSTRGSTRAR
ncbi:transglutaminaseTgpA domain-containing protein [Leifsonia poae]|uniref:transglutaminaseTgpA domain-containing protein n=1 Tax=Leifsonia poae TaxID=110933 RepID=UPI003D68DB26